MVTYILTAILLHLDRRPTTIRRGNWTMRKVFFWLHLTAGISAGLVIFIMSVTGTLLMYEKQMTSWFDRRSLPSIGTGARLSIEQLLEQARKHRGKLPSSIAVQADPAAPVQLAYGREIVYQDPSNGSILGAGNLQVRRFFRAVTDWHRWLAASDEMRPTGRAITGYSNLVFLFIVLSGAYLWLPRLWTKASVRAVALFRGGLSGKARDFNWHNVIGVWSVVPLVFIVASGCVISFPWASNLVYSMTGTSAPTSGPRRGSEGQQKGGGTREAPNAQGRPSGSGPAAMPAPPDNLNLSGLNGLWDKAAGPIAEWRSVTMRLPSSEKAPVTFVMDQGYAGQPQKRLTVSYERRTTEIKSSEAYSDLNTGRRVRTWLRFVHTGEFYGLPGQTVAGIASGGGAVLAYTGIALSLRRWAAWRVRRARAKSAEGELFPDADQSAA
jgi:uncharacterized iron-regulated membrane protein